MKLPCIQTRKNVSFCNSGQFKWQKNKASKVNTDRIGEKDKKVKTDEMMKTDSKGKYEGKSENQLSLFRRT